MKTALENFEHWHFLNTIVDQIFGKKVKKSSKINQDQKLGIHFFRIF